MQMNLAEYLQKVQKANICRSELLFDSQVYSFIGSNGFVMSELGHDDVPFTI